MLSTVLQNFGSLTTMRILSRIIHFILKTYLIRTQLDEQVLAHLLHLDLLLTTSLHVARSCFKPSYQKVENQDHVIKSSMNIMSFGVLATIGSTIIVSLMQHYQFITSGKSLNNFTNAIVLYSLASVCESIAEKYMVECLIKFEYFKIGLIEVISVIPKTIFIVIAVLFNWFSSVGILVFGVSQVLYSLTMMAIFFIISSNKTLFLQPFNSNGQVIYFDPKSKAALKEFSLLSFLKLILQQFEQIVLVVKDSSHISSIYSLINNLGSIVVRYIFAPLNQIIFNHFSRGKEDQSIKALESFLKITVYFSVLIVEFGFNYAEVVLRFLYSQKWVSEESISALRTFMVLLIFLGLNGIIEAFLFAKGKDSIKKYNFFSIITTGIYLSCSVLLLEFGYGAAGLFLGKIINMGSRILLCWYLQLRHHINLTMLIKQSLPSPLFFIVSIAIFFLSHQQYGIALHIFEKNMFTLALGVFLFGFNLIPIIYQNRHFLLQEVKKRWIKEKKND